jgi:cytochrome P450
MDIEFAGELKYADYCINEGMRITPPVPNHNPYYSTKDTQLGKIHVVKGDTVSVNMWSLHNNENEWPNPREYIPDRFDSSSHHFLNAKGERRHPMSFAPFSGGTRICFGKSFAEYNLKYIVTAFTQLFDFELSEKDKYPGQEVPIAMLFQAKQIPIYMTLKERAK